MQLYSIPIPVYGPHHYTTFEKKIDVELNEQSGSGANNEKTETEVKSDTQPLEKDSVLKEKKLSLTILFILVFCIQMKSRLHQSPSVSKENNQPKQKLVLVQMTLCRKMTIRKEKLVNRNTNFI